MTSFGRAIQGKFSPFRERFSPEDGQRWPCFRRVEEGVKGSLACGLFFPGIIIMFILL